MIEIKNRKCKNCGTMFVPRRSDAQFCKSSCRVSNYNKRKYREKMSSVEQIKEVALPKKKSKNKMMSHLLAAFLFFGFFTGVISMMWYLIVDNTTFIDYVAEMGIIFSVFYLSGIMTVGVYLIIDE